MSDDLKTDENRGIPSWHTVVLWAGMILLSMYACTRGIAAGDTWVALACGKHFSNHKVDTVEPFSFNSHKAGPTEAELEKFPEWSRGMIKKIHPTGWVNQNWGTHRMYYTLSKAFGSEGEYNYDMLVVWKFAVTMLSTICIYYLGRALGANAYLSAFSACFAVYIARTFIDIRPAVFSNLLVPLFALILVLTAYRNIRYIWFLIPLSVFWCNFHGGYIYIFIMMVGFTGMHLLLSVPNERFVSLGLRDTRYIGMATIVAFVATIIFNPFHLTNVTHTFIIMFSKHAASWKNVAEWHSAFEWDNRVGSSIPFLIMFIIMWVVLGFWLIARMLKPRVVGKMSRQVNRSESSDFQWPKIDLAILSVVAVTVYMAVGSRRFIPIAAALVCPVMAVFIDQSFKMITASRRFKKDFTLQPASVRSGFIKTSMLGFTLLIITLGVVWGAQFKRSYLDPWGNDAKRTSIFMRMTASYMKPFEVCEFINDNKLSGHLFNYWTEGGAIAFGQTPDPETGHIPLKLFMDGRAQAAYDHATYQKWTYIRSGGPTVQRAMLSGRSLTVADHKKIGEWITKELDAYDVWVVLLPDDQVYNPRFNTFAKSLQSTGHWRIVYMDDWQNLYVNTNTKKGLDLINKVVRQQAVYPDDYSRYLSTGFAWIHLRDRELSLRGFEYLKKAFEIHPTEAGMRALMTAAGFEHIKPRVFPYVENYLKKFTANKDSYAKEDGYYKQLLGARFAAASLASRYGRSDAEKSRYYKALDNEYVTEFKTKYGKTRW